ncbi:hypothetical protein DI005_17315 [Prauserella sp. PE36]|nr:hypothetical protein DI005_17315 [Prauserella sp. PE36]
MGLVEMAMLADFALGGALRREVGLTRPLPTLSLTLDLAGPLASDGTITTAEAGEIAIGPDGIGTAAGEFRGRQAVFGHCTATFAIPSKGRQGALPWDDPVDTSRPETPRTPEPGDLGAGDEAVLRAVRAADDAGRSWGDHLIAEATVDHPAGYVLRPTAAMTNRAGAVQGGVLFAMAARYGAPRDDGPRPRLAAGTMRFLAATDAETPVWTESLTEHATRRSVFTQVRLLQRNNVRAVAGLVYRR